MSQLHLFNPENDLALAIAPRQFTPPKGALAIRRAGQLLPLWWAGNDDYVLVDDNNAIAEAEIIKRRYGLGGSAVYTAPKGAVPKPWGWSLYTREVFRHAGIDNGFLPDDGQLEKLRLMSHRRTTIAIHRLIGTPPHMMPTEAASLTEAMKTIDDIGDAVVKLPWSSSGRGVIYSASTPSDTFRNYVAGMINRQGSVLIEPRYDRTDDFALLFYCSDGKASFRGLSMFATDGKGFYGGNLVMPQEEIRKLIDLDITTRAESLQKAITIEIAPYYTGWLGVDMLKYRTADGSIAIASCIEVNLRMTMGVAAMAVASHLENDTPMMLRVDPIGIVLESAPRQQSRSIR